MAITIIKHKDTFEFLCDSLDDIDTLKEITLLSPSDYTQRGISAYVCADNSVWMADEDGFWERF